jgi:hypothetical protein
MQRTIRARYHQGRIEPLEPLELADGVEVIITVPDSKPTPAHEDPTTETAGAWKDLLECPEFEKEVYQTRSAVSSERTGHGCGSATNSSAMWIS